MPISANTNQFIILDGAKMQSHLLVAKQFNEEGRCLYSGEPEKTLGHVAPWLFPFERKSNFADWFIASSGKQNWGILLETKMEMNQVYMHLKKFLRVKFENGKNVYFRFYDPRVLPTFLNSCPEDQLLTFFGDIKQFMIEVPDKGYFSFSVEEKKLVVKPYDILGLEDD